MSQESSQKITFEEFLEFDDGTDFMYELEHGELIQMASESEINQRIASFLFSYFLQLGIPYYRLRMKSEIAVNSQRVGVRVPDLVIFSEELAAVMQGAKRSLVMLDMPAPELVVELVSPSQESRDYRYKRSEYAARGILEYWVVDAIAQKVTLFQWVEGFYDEFVFTDDMVINSPLLGELTLTAAQVLQG
ncbi:Uma2 family endonuclease [Pseudanabaena yagii GIHE-NHR1]|uniref:Uma2 family endonuclease n=1 Tax=Pseudanabaena yagii GIHE-NHR1 TaxID=2722753 RepID=A0ABX1LPW5_9CYAN|nr:Uma2 family endonuclease [Pseudanabaena yagii GIHE-NHR1]